MEPQEDLAVVWRPGDSGASGVSGPDGAYPCEFAYVLAVGNGSESRRIWFSAFTCFPLPPLCFACHTLSYMYHSVMCISSSKLGSGKRPEEERLNPDAGPVLLTSSVWSARRPCLSS
jgi:hypothetical protein